jgi:hypothetical protein
VLYKPEAFEPLTDEEWNEARVREAIRAIAADATAALDPERLWPAEEWDAWEAQLPLTNLYLGASRVSWALAALQSRGHADARRDLPAVALCALESWRVAPDYEPAAMAPAQTDASLFSGESGVLLVAWRLAPSDELAERLLERVRENVDNEANELFSGSPGTMLVARAMLEWTGDQRWADTWRESADLLWRRRDADGLWTYAPSGRGLGASHGVATTANVLLQGGDLLGADRRDALRRETAATLARTAVLEAGLANWPMTAEAYPNLVADDGQVRLQWCHGAAGVVASSATYLDEDLLLAGAKLVWRAGPLGMEKGPGICHGTAGNGYALLKAFERTGDERWLERARLFAVHALGEVERWRARRGRGRYSLWTGDVGTALYAADCLDCRTAVPIVDGLTS